MPCVAVSPDVEHTPPAALRSCRRSGMRCRGGWFSSAYSCVLWATTSGHSPRGFGIEPFFIKQPLLMPKTIAFSKTDQIRGWPGSCRSSPVSQWRGVSVQPPDAGQRHADVFQSGALEWILLNVTARAMPCYFALQERNAVGSLMWQVSFEIVTHSERCRSVPQSGQHFTSFTCQGLTWQEIPPQQVADDVDWSWLLICSL